jgi:2-hydroxy-6-oxonona-2,4-dienedioate hydrolase
MHIQFLTAGGIRTRVIESGRGEPLLLLHPVGFSADVWLRNLSDLGARRRVCAPDLLGHGFTDLYDDRGDIGHAALMTHLEALVDRLDFEQFSIVGSSFGAQLALLLGLRMPARIKRLVVVGSGTALQTEAETVATLGKTLANGSSAFDTATWDSCRQRLANLCFDGTLDFDPLILSQLTAYAREGAAQAYKSLLAAMLDVNRARPFRVAERLNEVAAPTLLLWGRQDPRASHARAEAAVACFPRARLHTIERCGHLPFYEHPGEFNRTVSRFLDAL